MARTLFMLMASVGVVTVALWCLVQLFFNVKKAISKDRKELAALKDDADEAVERLKKAVEDAKS